MNWVALFWARATGDVGVATAGGLFVDRATIPAGGVVVKQILVVVWDGRGLGTGTVGLAGIGRAYLCSTL